MARVTLELFGKPGCHLCEDARVVIDDVLVDFPEVDLIERNILDDPELFEEFTTLIPVVVIDGVRHATWRLDGGSLRNALMEVAS